MNISTNFKYPPFRLKVISTSVYDNLYHTASIIYIESVLNPEYPLISLLEEMHFNLKKS